MVRFRLVLVGYGTGCSSTNGPLISMHWWWILSGHSLYVPVLHIYYMGYYSVKNTLIQIGKIDTNPLIPSEVSINEGSSEWMFYSGTSFKMDDWQEGHGRSPVTTVGFKLLSQILVIRCYKYHTLLLYSFFFRPTELVMEPPGELQLGRAAKSIDRSQGSRVVRRGGCCWNFCDENLRLQI